MCIAMIKPRGVAGPDKDVYERCFMKNPDGAGFAILDNNGVHIQKGLMTFDEFWDAFQAGITNDPKDLVILTHFRIGTHGSKNNPKHTHPFPVVTDYPTMELLKWSGQAVMAHNGIFNLPGIAGGYNSRIWVGSKEVEELPPSDSMEFTKNVLSLMMDNSDLVADIRYQGLVEHLSSGNRVVMISDVFPSGFKTYGNWITDTTTGLVYSNEGFRPPTPVVQIPKINNWNAYNERKSYWQTMFEDKQEELPKLPTTPALTPKTEHLAKIEGTFANQVKQRHQEILNDKNMSLRDFNLLTSKLRYTWFIPIEITLWSKADKNSIIKITNPRQGWYTDANRTSLYYYVKRTSKLEYQGTILTVKTLG